MEPAVIAAVIVGICTVLGALIQVIFKRRSVKRRADSMAPATTSQLSVAIAFIQREHQVLLVRRKKREGRLAWQFPAGVVKPGANVTDAVEKEVRNETGVTIRADKIIGSRIHPDTKVLCHYLLCTYLHGEAENLDADENSEVKWVNAWDVAPSYVTSDVYTEVHTLLKRIASDYGKGNTVVAVVVKGDHVLVVKRRMADGACEWWFPGGTVKFDESEQRAIAREVFEETNIRCEVLEKLGQRYHEKTKQHLDYYACQYVSGDAALREPDKFEAISWMTVDQVCENLHDVYGPVIDYLKN